MPVDVPLREENSTDIVNGTVIQLGGFAVEY
jgi:hypothetical protein